MVPYHSFGNSSKVMVSSKIILSGCAIWPLVTFKIFGQMLSGPGDLFTLIFFRTFIKLCSETSIEDKVVFVFKLKSGN